VRAAPHTVSVFDDELERLRALVCEMGGRVEAAIGEAVGALVELDRPRALAVVADDARIDALAAQIELEAVQLIALRAPLADDLREVLAAFKIAGLVARMGDCAKNIAHRAMLAGDCRTAAPLQSLDAMKHAALGMVKGALDAFTTRNPAAAAQIAAQDDVLDRFHASISRALIEMMADDPRHIEAATQLLFVSQKLERIGDHAVGIADTVRFAAGKDLR
jgi:phosphate transport system protein